MNFLKKIKDWILLPTNGATTKVCKHCKSEIDINAKICPNCRKKQPSRVKRIILVIFIAMVLLTMCSNGSDETTETKDTDKKVETTKAPKQEKKDEKKETPKPTKKAKTKAELEKEKNEFIKACKTAKYKDLMRNPDDYKGNKFKVKGKIEQTMDGGFLDNTKYYRVLVDVDGDGYYIDNVEYYVADKRIDKKPKLLDDDVIELFGTFKGTEKLTRVLGNSDEIPKIEMKYVKLISE